MLKQFLNLKLSQKLSPQQIQLMKLIQLPTQAFEQRLKEEMVENPALESGKEDDDELYEKDEFDNNDEYDDYEEIKRELEIFKTLEIGESLQGLNGESGENIPLERLLLEKNKKLENLNTTLKVSRFPYCANF